MSIVVASIKAKPTIDSEALTIKYLPFERVSCTYYPVRFKKNQVKIQPLINSNNNDNTITLLYETKLGVKVWTINIRI